MMNQIIFNYDTSKKVRMVSSDWPTIIELASIYKRLREFESVISSAEPVDEKI